MADTKPLSMIENELKSSIGTFLPQSNFLACFLLALIGVCRVTLYQIANAFPTTAKTQSNLKRIQRFLEDFRVTPEAFARAITVLLPVPQPWILALDRTEWKLGKIHFNLLVLAVVYKKMAFPLLWMALGPGPSDTAERILLVSRYLALFGKHSIAFVTADREFIGKEWISWLKGQQVSFRIRIRTTEYLENDRGEWFVAASLFPRRCGCRNRMLLLWGMPVFVGGKPLVGGDTLIVISDVFGDLLTDYRCRWAIETLFQALKSRGFDLEATHVTDSERLCRLLGLLALGYVWCFRVGEDSNASGTVQIKKHARAAKSIFRAGLDAVRRLVLPLCGHFGPRAFVRIVGQLKPTGQLRPA
jgi:hypothetical protein